MQATKPALTEKLVNLARSNVIIPILLILEVAETTFAPFPYEAVFIALCLAARERIWIFIAVTVLGSAVAGSILYALGAGLAEPLAKQLGITEAVASYMATFEERGAVLIFLGGVTPVPSYLVNLAAGASGYPFIHFVALFSASRFLRFAVLGLLLFFFGETILERWKKLPRCARRLFTVSLLIAVVLWSASALF